MVAPIETDSTLPTAAYSAFYQWVQELPGFRAVKWILTHTKVPASDGSALLAELAELKEAFAKLPNKGMRHLGKIDEAYKTLKVHFCSEWEESEIEVFEGLAEGKYDDWSTAFAGPPLLGFKLYLLAVHGGFEKAVPFFERAALEAPNTVDALWCRWLATGDIDEGLLAALLARLRSSPRPYDSGAPIFFVDPDMEAAEEMLAKLTSPKQRELSERPVKSIPKLLTQLLAYRRGTLPADVLRKSFGAVYGTCYPYESYFDLRDKIGLCCLQGRYLDTSSSRRLLVEGIKNHLAMFSPKRRAERARFVKDVKPVMNVLERIEQVLAQQRGVKILRGVDRTSIETFDSTSQ